MTAVARYTRETTSRHPPRRSPEHPSQHSLTPPSITSHSPSFDTLQESMSNRARQDTAMRSARAKAAYAACREYGLDILGRPPTAKEPGLLRHLIHIL